MQIRKKVYIIVIKKKKKKIKGNRSPLERLAALFLELKCSQLASGQGKVFYRSDKS